MQVEDGQDGVQPDVALEVRRQGELLLVRLLRVRSEVGDLRERPLWCALVVGGDPGELGRQDPCAGRLVELAGQHLGAHDVLGRQFRRLDRGPLTGGGRARLTGRAGGGAIAAAGELEDLLGAADPDVPRLAGAAGELLDEGEVARCVPPQAVAGRRGGQHALGDERADRPVAGQSLQPQHLIGRGHGVWASRGRRHGRDGVLVPCRAAVTHPGSLTAADHRGQGRPGSSTGTVNCPQRHISIRYGSSPTPDDVEVNSGIDGDRHADTIPKLFPGLPANRIGVIVRQQTQSRTTPVRPVGATPRERGDGSAHGGVAALQRTAGNAAVEHMLAQRVLETGSQDGGAPPALVQGVGQVLQQGAALAQQNPGLAHAAAAHVPNLPPTHNAVALAAIAQDLQAYFDQQVDAADQLQEQQQEQEPEPEWAQEAPAQDAPAKKPFFDGDWSKGLGNAGAGLGLVLQIAGTYSGNKPMAYAGAGLSGLAGLGDAASEGKKLWADGKMNLPKLAGGVLGAAAAGTLGYAASAVPAGMSAATFVSGARTAGLSIAVAGVLTKALGEAKKWEDCWPFKKAAREPDIEMGPVGIAQ